MGQGCKKMNRQYLPLPFLFPLTYSPLDCHWHEMGSRGSAKKKVEGLQHPAEAAVPRPILARISGHRAKGTAHVIKILEMGRLSWVTQVGPRSSKDLSKREAEGPE